MLTDFDARKLCYEIHDLVEADQVDNAVTVLQIELGLAYSGGQFDAREGK